MKLFSVVSFDSDCLPSRPPDVRRKCDDLSLDHPVRVDVMRFEGKSHPSVGLIVTKQTHRTVTLVSIMLQMPMSTESPRTINTLLPTSPFDEPTSWISHDFEKRAEPIACNDAGTVAICRYH